MRWSENLITGMEQKFHANWSKNRRDRGLCMYCVQNNILFFQISIFLDVANASSMPHLLRNLILMILFLFYRTILSCVKGENCVKSIIQCQSSKSYQQSKHQCKSCQQFNSTLLKRRRCEDIPPIIYISRLQYIETRYSQCELQA